MKRFFVIAALLLAGGGTAFFAGWAQLAVPAGMYGVVESKTHGLRAELVRGGEFTWIWYRLIPGNVRIRSFRLERRALSLDISGELPQASVISALTGLKTGFSWHISGELSYSVRPESLSGLIARNGIETQEALDAYLEREEGEIRAYTGARAAFYVTDGAEAALRAISETGEARALTGDLTAAFPFMFEPQCRLSIVQLPDFAQWDTAKKLYTAYLERQRVLLEGETLRAAERKIASQFRFDELSRYGELLTKYPVLIQYLGLEQTLERKELP
ncbi:MAG: hypothetical protein LBC77_02150 [Spirochaetaceae bacterium]|nr:hypothetical protein [Spirochaetaceae bacterium]